MGDNRSQSRLARVGTVPRANLIGRFSRPTGRPTESPSADFSLPWPAGRERPPRHEHDHREHRAAPAAQGRAPLQGGRHRPRPLPGDRGLRRPRPGVRGDRDQAPGSGVRETFTVRKQSFGVGVERTFPVHSPKIEKIEVGSVGDVNRAKLYYLREKVGKKARVRELRQTPAQLAAARAEAEALAAAQAEAAEAEAAGGGRGSRGGRARRGAGRRGARRRGSRRACRGRCPGGHTFDDAPADEQV